MLHRCEDATLARVAFQDAEPSPWPEERALVAAARTERRRAELAAGRTAARRALEALGLRPSLAVLSDPDGRPVLAGDAPLPACVSIAHDGDHAWAAAARQPVGIDVLVLSRVDEVARVVARRIDTGRARPLRGAVLPGLDAAMMVWTAWEALGSESGRAGACSPGRCCWTSAPNLSMKAPSPASARRGCAGSRT